MVAEKETKKYKVALRSAVEWATLTLCPTDMSYLFSLYTYLFRDQCNK